MRYLIIVLAVCMAACRSSSYTSFTQDPVVYARTVKELNNIVLENNFAPMVAARNYAYANIAAYECIAAGNSGWQSLSGQIVHMPEMPKPAPGPAIDHSLAALLAFVKVGNAVTFPEGSMLEYYERLLNKADSMGIPSSRLNATRAFADSVASAILLWSKGDHYAATRGSSRFPIDETPGRWVPTPPMYATALEPHWKDIRPMVLDSAAQFRCPPPPVFNMKNRNSVYYQALMEVKNTGDSLNDEQKHIAEFWDDNPFKMNVTGHVMYATKKFSPAGHWMNIVGIAAQRARADLPTTIAAYAQTSIALFDGFISCWNEKYASNYIRPETVINQEVDANWQPYIQTPPFPSYVSGHSTISAAAAEVMTNYFGELSFKDTSSVEFGIDARSFRSFREAAQEASISRLYGGIHYRFDLDEGNVLGKRVGDLVWRRLRLHRNSKN